MRAGLALLIPVLLALTAHASAQRAHLIADAATGRVLAARNANAPSYPASLTKLMTAFITIADLESGELELEQTLRISSTAAATPPIDMGLRAGDVITVRQALLGIIVRSANDAAVVLAEGIAGDEDEFVRRMNFTAADLGMRSTQFRNASGLPHPEQVTTARDLAVLVAALQEALPAYYGLFATKSFRYGGRTYNTHNGFLSYGGAEGLKTGFTCRAGFTLAASARRGDRRLIGVVLGAQSTGERNAKMRRLFDAGFRQALSQAEREGAQGATDQHRTLANLEWAREQGKNLTPNIKVLAKRCTSKGKTLAYMKPAKWSLEFAVARDWDGAVAASRRILSRQRKRLRGAKPLVIPRVARDLVFRAGLTGMSRKVATETCLEIRKTRNFCVVLAPATAAQAIKQGQRALAARR